jgi:hypothetical protein
VGEREEVEEFLKGANLRDPQVEPVISRKIIPQSRQKEY